MYTFCFFELVAHVEHVADTHDDEGGYAVETYIFSNGFVPPRLAKNGKKGMGCTVEGAGGGALQKSGRVQTTLKSLLLQAILLTTWELLSGRGRLKGEII